MRLLALLSLCTGVLVFLVSANAELAAQVQSTALSIEPAVIDDGAAPGSTIERTITISNTSESFLPIRLSAQAMRTQSESWDELPILSAHEWITFDEANFILEPSERRMVEVAVDIPADAGPGGHYADVIVRALVLERPGQFAVAMPELTASMFVTVTGDIVEEHQANLIGQLFRFRSRSAPRHISYQVENTGNVHSLFTPSLIITNDRTSFTDSVPLEPDFLLPGEGATLTFALPPNLPLGLHRVMLDYSFGSEQISVDTQTAEVFIMPFSITWLYVITTALLAGVAYRHRLRLQKAYRALRHGAYN